MLAGGDRPRQRFRPRGPRTGLRGLVSGALHVSWPRCCALPVAGPGSRPSRPPACPSPSPTGLCRPSPVSGRRPTGLERRGREPVTPASCCPPQVVACHRSHCESQGEAAERGQGEASAPPPHLPLPLPLYSAVCFVNKHICPWGPSAGDLRVRVEGRHVRMGWPAVGTCAHFWACL